METSKSITTRKRWSLEEDTVLFTTVLESVVKHKSFKQIMNGRSMRENTINLLMSSLFPRTKGAIQARMYSILSWLTEIKLEETGIQIAFEQWDTDEFVAGDFRIWMETSRWKTTTIKTPKESVKFMGSLTLKEDDNINIDVSLRIDKTKLVATQTTAEYIGDGHFVVTTVSTYKY